MIATARAIQRALVAGIEVLALHHYRKRAQDHAKVDLLEQMRQRGRNGLTPTTAACLMTKKDKPSRSEIEKARRALERLVTHELAYKQPSILGGRGAEATYLPAARKDQL